MTTSQPSAAGDTRVAVVTGGGSGIGQATTQQLKAADFRVAVLDIGEVSAPADLVVRADVTDPGDVTRAVDDIISTFGRIDVLVNNAGITGSAQATNCHQTPIEEWNRVLAVNVSGPFLCSKAVLPIMLQQNSGHIIIVASVAGLIAFPGRSAYTTSKGAAVALTKSLAVDYAAHGIRANAVCPGMVETPMTSWRLNNPSLRAQIESKIPMGRVALPEEIAEAITLLASNRLDYMNGHTFVLDGGWSSW